MDRDGALLGTLRELLEQLLPPNEPHEDAPLVDEPREEEDAPSPADEPQPADEPREGEDASDAASDTDSVPDLASASSSSDSDEGPPPARRRPRMPALAPASSSDSESDGEAPELASASSSDDEEEAPPPRRAAAGPRVVRVGRHVLVVGGGPGEGGRPDLGDRPARVRTCVEINQCVGCTRQFFTKSFLGDDAAVLAPSSCEEPASPRYRAGVALMA